MQTNGRPVCGLLVFVASMDALCAAGQNENIQKSVLKGGHIVFQSFYLNKASRVCFTVMVKRERTPHLFAQRSAI